MHHEVKCNYIGACNTSNYGSEAHRNSQRCFASLLKLVMGAILVQHFRVTQRVILVGDDSFLNKGCDKRLCVLAFDHDWLEALVECWGVYIWRMRQCVGVLIEKIMATHKSHSGVALDSIN